MPQMMPMYWMLLMLYFFIMFMLQMIMTYFNKNISINIFNISNKSLKFKKKW